MLISIRLLKLTLLIIIHFLTLSHPIIPAYLTLLTLNLLKLIYLIQLLTLKLLTHTHLTFLLRRLLCSILWRLFTSLFLLP